MIKQYKLVFAHIRDGESICSQFGIATDPVLICELELVHSPTIMANTWYIPEMHRCNTFNCLNSIETSVPSMVATEGKQKA